MELEDAARAWQTDGFVILPGFPPGRGAETGGWRARLAVPSAEGFHDDTDPRRDVSSATAGTVIAFEPGTLHRGTQLTAPRGVRYSMHLGFRPSDLTWGQRVGWAAAGFSAEWVEFVGRATAGQLQAFGFPPPGHPFWTPQTLAGMALRYPKLDLSPWHTTTPAAAT